MTWLPIETAPERGMVLLKCRLKCGYYSETTPEMTIVIGRRGSEYDDHEEWCCDLIEVDDGFPDEGGATFTKITPVPVGWLPLPEL